MAINGEAVIYNFGPLAQVALQQAAQKKYENAQLDRQLAVDAAKLSPKGIRPQEIGKYMQSYNDLKTFSIRNRDALRSGRDPAAFQEYQDKLANLQATINESLAAKEREKEAISFGAKNHDKIDYDDYMKHLSAVKAPVGTPEYESAKTWDISQSLWNEAKTDLGKWATTFNQAVKPREVGIPETLPTGQVLNKKKIVREPEAIANFVGRSYDGGLYHIDKLYNKQFDTLAEDHKAELEDYAGKYIPGFKVDSPRNLAIADNLYGQVEQDMGSRIGGSPYKAQQAFQREQQNRSFAQQEKMWQKSVSGKDEGYYLVNDMASALKSNDMSKVIAPIQAASSPGVQTLFLKSGQTPERQLQEINRAMKTNGLDGKTKLLTPDDFASGVVVVAVPRINKETKQPIKDVYDYMAISRKESNPQVRLNQVLNYARGGAIKPLPDKYYKQQFGAQTIQQPSTDFAPGFLDEDDEDETEEN